VTEPSALMPMFVTEEAEFLILETLRVLIAVMVNKTLRENLRDFAKQNQTIDHDCPTGTVTVMPALIVIGPADIAFFGKGVEGNV
jgi:hypothetical protein